MNIIDKEIHNGFQIDIYIDEDTGSPHDLDNEDAFLVYNHRDFNVTRKNFECHAIHAATNGFQSKFRLSYNGYYVFTVYAYIHGSISLSLSNKRYPYNDRWDVSSTGYILVSISEHMDYDDATERAKSLIHLWNMYLSGQVYGYYTAIGGCSGYYGHEGIRCAINDAKDEIDAYIKNAVNRHIKKQKRIIKSKVPLIYRKEFKV